MFTYRGLIGDTRQFGLHALYHYQLWAVLIGAFLPIICWLLTRWHPNSYLRYVSTPVILIGLASIPPAVGINYSSWFFVGFLFQYLLRTKNFPAWSKYNYIISAALSSGEGDFFVFVAFNVHNLLGTTISVFVIFFALQVCLFFTDQVSMLMGVVFAVS
jgi:hypothetical protein